MRVKIVLNVIILILLFVSMVIKTKTSDHLSPVTRKKGTPEPPRSNNGGTGAKN